MESYFEAIIFELKSELVQRTQSLGNLWKEKTAKKVKVLK